MEKWDRDPEGCRSFAIGEICRITASHSDFNTSCLVHEAKIIWRAGAWAMEYSSLDSSRNNLCFGQTRLIMEW
jgi:hypothetical protein